APAAPAKAATPSPAPAKSTPAPAQRAQAPQAAPQSNRPQQSASKAEPSTTTDSPSEKSARASAARRGGEPTAKPTLGAIPRSAQLRPRDPSRAPDTVDVAESEQSPLRGASARVVTNMETSLTVPTATSVRAVPAKLLVDNRVVINNHLNRSRGGKVSFT